MIANPDRAEKVRCGGWRELRGFTREALAELV
jgi:hypothetical protein